MAALKKIAKEAGAEPTELEEQVAQVRRRAVMRPVVQRWGWGCSWRHCQDLCCAPAMEEAAGGQWLAFRTQSVLACGGARPAPARRLAAPALCSLQQQHAAGARDGVLDRAQAAE